MPKRSHHRLLRALPFVEHSAPANEYVEGEVDFRVTECGAVGLGGVVLPIAVGPLLHAVQQPRAVQCERRGGREGGAQAEAPRGATRRRAVNFSQPVVILVARRVQRLTGRRRAG